MEFKTERVNQHMVEADMTALHRWVPEVDFERVQSLGDEARNELVESDDFFAYEMLEAARRITSR